MESLARRAFIVPIALALSCKAGTPALKPCTADAECGDKGICGRGGVCFLDEAAPRITIASPLAKDVVTQGSVTLEGAVSDGQGSGVVRVEYAVNGGAFSDAVVAGDRFSATVPLKEEDGAPVVLEVRAADRIGNEGRASIAFVVDRVAPRISVVQPPLTAVGKKGVGSTVAVGFRAVDGSGRVAKLEVSEDGGATFRQAGEVAREVTLSAKVEDSIESKRFAGVARATDAAGNVSKPIAAAVVLIDTVDPVLTLLSPQDKAVIRAGDPPKVLVQGTIKESNLVSMGALWSGGTLAVSPDKTGAFSGEIPLGNEDGVPHVVQLTALDAAGNRAQVLRTFTVDRVTPRLTIDSPAQDADCTGTGACTGAVFNASANAVVFSGTADDGGGLAAKGGLVGEIGGVKADAQRTGNKWTFSWTNPPQDNGKTYEFVLTAIDSAGNTAVAKRKIFLDRVVPVATAILDQKRLVSRSADVVAFSEPMDRSSVAAAITANGAPFSVRASDSDGKSYGPLSQLEPYTYFELTVDRGAKDRVGNPIGAALKQEFLTETLPPSASSPLSDVASPSLAVDRDGIPIVVFWDPVIMVFRIARWDGRGAWEKNTIALEDAVGAPCARGSDFQLAQGSGPKLGTTHSVDVALCSEPGLPSRMSGVFFSRSEGDFSKWSGEDGWRKSDTVDTEVSPRGGLSMIVSCIPFVGCSKSIRYLHATSTLGGRREVYTATFESRSQPKRWVSKLTLVTSSAGVDTLGGAAALNHGTAHWVGGLGSGVDTGLPTGLTVPTAVVGRAALWDNTHTIGSAHLLIAGSVAGIPRLAIACAENPTAPSSWKEVYLPTPSRDAIEEVELALGDKLVTLAVRTAAREVYFATAPNVACTSAPSVSSWTAPVRDAESPVVGFAKGKFYKAYVDTKSRSFVLAP
jgi:hypothetical protein